LETVKDEYPETPKFQRLLKYYASVAGLDKLEYEKAETVIANSEEVKKHIIEYYEVEENRIEVIPNGVLQEECNFERPPERSDGMKIVLFPGTIHVMKGFHYLVEAMIQVRKVFPEAILLVCGRIHPYERELFMDVIEKRRRESGIILAGFVSREKLFRYYHMADVCCMPLLFGTMSIALLESVAHGLPIVTTVHSGFPEVNKVGIEIPPKDASATADAIISLLSNPKLRARKSQNAQRIIKNYFWTKIARDFLKIYDRFI
jgi:glycosyltransferase involved in cell wall biosynthesis